MTYTSLVEIVPSKQISIIQTNIKEDCLTFNKLDKGSKLKIANELYLNNRLLRECGNIAINQIGMLDEELELKDKRIDLLEDELKETSSYDEDKINSLMNKNPIFKIDYRERAKRRLEKTLKSIK